MLITCWMGLWLIQKARSFLPHFEINAPPQNKSSRQSALSAKSVRGKNGGRKRTSVGVGSKAQKAQRAGSMGGTAV